MQFFKYVKYKISHVLQLFPQVEYPYQTLFSSGKEVVLVQVPSVRQLGHTVQPSHTPNDNFLNGTLTEIGFGRRLVFSLTLAYCTRPLASPPRPRPRSRRSFAGRNASAEW